MARKAHRVRREQDRAEAEADRISDLAVDFSRLLGVTVSEDDCRTMVTWVAYALRGRLRSFIKENPSLPDGYKARLKSICRHREKMARRNPSTG